MTYSKAACEKWAPTSLPHQGTLFLKKAAKNPPPPYLKWG